MTTKTKEKKQIVAALPKLPKGEAITKAKKHLATWLPAPLQTQAPAPTVADEDEDEELDEGDAEQIAA